MWNDIVYAVMEGRFLCTTADYIKRKIKLIFLTPVYKMDYAIGKIVRTIWSNRQKITDNKIVLTAVDGRYDCNPKYIVQEILNRGLPYELVWLVKDDKEMTNGNFPKELTLIKKGTYEAYQAMATARIWIENELKYLKPYALLKKEGQVYIQTWHGSLGFKRIGKANQHNQSGKKKRYINKVAEKCNRVTDICISNSVFETNVFREAYWNDTPILEYGHARNDVLFLHDAEQYRKLKEAVLTDLEVIKRLPDDFEKLAENEKNAIMKKRNKALNTKYILYAPTYRIDGSLEYFNVDFKRLVDSLAMRFGGNWKVLMRFHLHNRKAGKNMMESSYLINATAYPDMQELLCIADAGLSDYSSWLCDYALTAKPAFIYAVDFDSYGHDRGFYYPLETTPFPISRNNDELNESIIHFDMQKYEEKRRLFLEDKGCMEDGHAAGRIVDKIEQIINNKGVFTME
ncbi:MAG: CDP-glycerol glycerophosphotransferase family protein [Bacillus sp. (in: Bacteria)]|nr:CDP-glycerol glycerophosphotransferase family protein [Bacillus sp. (in: firmicutes)]MCM1426732.1 CDP-glycerol glycerophosphotransferase family protein [Eubacterium sp.]